MMNNSDKQNTFRIITASAIGSLVEWYDFMIYAYLAVTISQVFFPSMDSQKNYVLAFLLFGLSYLARPIGGVVFGLMGDRAGRQKTLIASQLLMAIPTLLFALLPGYKAIGIAAPILLGVIRFFQGFSAGGEHSTAGVYLAEMAPVRRRGLWISIVPFSSALGILLSSLVVYLLSNLFSEASFMQWGWRLGVFFGFLLSVFGVWYRLSLPETDVFSKARSEPKSNNVFNRNVKKQVLCVFGLVGSMVFFYQLIFTWSPSGLSQHFDFSLETMLFNNTIAMLFFIVFIFIGAWLVDCVGRRVVLALSVLFLMLFASFFFSGVGGHGSSMLFFCFCLAASLFGLFMASVNAVYCEVFPAKIRVLTLALAYNIPAAIIGGLAPTFFNRSIIVSDMLPMVLAIIFFGLIGFVCALKVDDLTGKEI